MRIALLILLLAPAVRAQRQASDKPAGAPATILASGLEGFAATGYGSARFLKATMPDVESRTAAEGFTVSVSEGGELRIAASGGASTATAERYFDWPADDAMIVFRYYAHGLDADEGLMVQGWASTISRNLHANVSARAQDRWQAARIAVGSMVGFGGGAVQAGETFGNLMFVVRFDPAVRDAYLLIDQLVIFRGPDGVPPTAPPTGLRAALAGDGSIRLAWQPARDDVGVYLYEVHRGAADDFQPDRRTRLDTVSDLGFVDSTAPPEATCVYRVIAIDPGGHRAASEAVTITTPAVATGAGQPLEF